MVETTQGEDISALLKAVPSLHPIETEMILRGRYETKFKIHNHNLNHREEPMPLIAYREVEGMEFCDPMYDRIRNFARFEVHKWFGMSFTEVIKLPREYVDFIYRISQERTKTAEDMVTKSLEDLTRPQGPPEKR